jgi:hypothetical protein
MYLSKHVVVSARIDIELRKKLNELGIEPSEVIKKALEKEVEEREAEERLRACARAGLPADDI